MLTSLKNPRVRDVLSLRDRRERDRQGIMIVEGLRELSLALTAGISFRTFFLCPAMAQREDFQLAEQAGAMGVEIVEVSEPVAVKIGYGERGAASLALAAIPAHRPEDLKIDPKALPLVLVLDGFEKPGNVGAAFRVADGAGVDAVLVADTGTDVYNPNTIRASLGTVFSVPHAVAPAQELLQWCKRLGLQILAAAPGARCSYTEVDYRPASAIVTGSEHAGLNPLWTESADVTISIPMKGTADSLNAAASTAVLTYEALRQRTERKRQGN